MADKQAIGGDGMPVLENSAQQQLEQQQQVAEQERQQQIAEQQRQFVEQEILSLYQQLKYDLEDFERHAKYIDTVAVNMISTGEAEHRLSSLLKLEESITATSRQLRTLGLSNTQSTKLSEHMQFFHSSCCVSIGKYQDLISDRNRVMQSQQHAQSHLNSSGASSSLDMRVKLPQFVLPDFDGSLDKWLEWRDTFNSVIHRNTNLSKAAKYYYLRNAVKFPAGQSNVLNNFSFDENSYEEAWKSLCDRFNDKRKLKGQLFIKLLSVKHMASDTAPEVRRMLDSFASLVTSMKLLECSFDDLLVHIVQSRFDDETAKEWQKFIGKQEVTFGLMKEFLTRYWSTLDSLPSEAKRQHPSKSSDSESSSSSSSTSLVSSSFQCHWCKQPHMLYQCPKFLEATFEERFNFVRESKLCEICFSSSHDGSQCQYAMFRKCSACGEAHNELIHQESKSLYSSDQPSQSPVPSPRFEEFRNSY
jgi:Protein of unknown function (DUF1759)